MEEILDLPQETHQQPRHYAGFWIRFGAIIIDSIILGVVQAILAFAIFGGFAAVNDSLAMNFISIGLGIAYYCGMESSAKQATLGKMAVGIRVGNKAGQQISFANALGRYFAKIISALVLFVGFMMAGWDDRKQALHDKLADTYVFYN